MVLLYHLFVINLANCLVLLNPNFSSQRLSTMETEISAKAHFRKLILIMDTANHLAEYLPTMTTNVSALRITITAQLSF
eukprot:scaffold15397_cov89-Skeletonema_dohrnii-CCMP3373.AAC.1